MGLVLGTTAILLLAVAIICVVTSLYLGWKSRYHEAYHLSGLAAVLAFMAALFAFVAVMVP